MPNSFSLTNIFYSIDTDMIAYLLLFLIFFALIHWLLNRTMLKDSKGVLNVISISSALLVVYGLIRANFSIAELMFRMNLPPMFQYNLVWIIFLLIFIILWVKIGLGICLMIIGLGLIIIGALKLIYADTEAIITGAVLFVLGFIWYRWRKHRKEMKNMSLKDRQEYLIARRGLKRAKRKEWYERGRRWGHRVGGVIYNNKIKKPGKGFQYKAGMRRGGTTKRRSRFVGRKLADKYAEKYGKKAANKRFNKYKT